MLEPDDGLPHMAELGEGVLPPYSEEAEKAVIASCILDPGLIPEVTRLLKPEQFYNGRHRHYFQTISKMHNEGEPVDVVTVANHLRSAGSFGTPELMSLTEDLIGAPSVTNVTAHAKVVLSTAVKRELITTARSLLAHAYHSDDDVALIADAHIAKIGEALACTQSIMKGPRPLSESMSELAADFGKTKPRVLSTGVQNYDDLLKGGMRPKTMHVICGRPGMGKSAAALGIALNVARQGEGVLFFSLEMAERDVNKRSVSFAGRIHADSIDNETLTDYEKQVFDKTVEKLKSLPFEIDEESGLTIQEIVDRSKRAALRFAAKGSRLGLIVVDYLQLVDGRRGNKQDNKAEEIRVVAQALHGLSKELDCTVLALAQFNRMADSHEVEPQMSWIADSSGIEKAADVITFILPVDRNPAPNTDGVRVRWWLAKNRSGKPSTSAHMWFYGCHSRFEPDYERGTND